MKKDIQQKDKALGNENKTGEKTYVFNPENLNNEGRRDVERMLKLMIASHRPG